MDILLLHGANSYLSKKYLSKEINSFINYNGLDSVIRIDGSECLAEKVLLEVDTMSFFSNKKLVVVKYFSKNPESKRFVEYLKDSKISTIENVRFIFWDNVSVDKRSVFYKYINEFFEVKSFDELKGSKLINWIKEELTSSNIVFSSGVPEKISERVGNELWRIQSEIEKLNIYKSGGRVSIEDVEKVVPISASLEVWELTSAIVSGDKVKALKVLETLIQQGNEIHQIWGLIIWQFRQLILIKSQKDKGLSATAISTKLKINPYIVRKIVGNRNDMSFNKLKLFYDKLTEIDYQIKTSLTEPLFAVTLLLSVI